MMKLWTALWHNSDAPIVFPLWCADGYVPTESDALTLMDDYNPEEDRVDIDGPMDVPQSPHFGPPIGTGKFTFLCGRCDQRFRDPEPKCIAGPACPSCRAIDGVTETGDSDG